MFSCLLPNISIANIISNSFIGFSKSFINAICAYLKIEAELPKDTIDSVLIEKI